MRKFSLLPCSKAYGGGVCEHSEADGGGMALRFAPSTPSGSPSPALQGRR